MGLGWDLRCCISPQLPGDAHDAGPWTTLCVARPVIFPWTMLSRHQLLPDWKLTWESTDFSLSQFQPFSPSPSQYFWILSCLVPFPSPFSFFLGKGPRRHLVFLGRVGSDAQALVCQPQLCLRKVKMDSISVLQLGGQEPIYTRKTKSNQSGYWIFCFVFVCFSINTLKDWMVLEFDPTVLIFSWLLGL